MDKYVLVECLSTIKTAICETFKNTQRIKLISFDVSTSYIILGTSSGGIYIFKRTPCEFLRLIPSKEGPTIQVKISPNETNLAIANSKGLVIILENFFVDLNLRPFLYNDHDGNTITVMKWHGNDLYCGDNTGRISVCTPSSTLTQAIFQSASSTLMHLDTSIVQIDTYKNYLLISTKTRTYLCDTEREQYKQIGKKLRDGYFGACFSQIDWAERPERIQLTMKAFKTLNGDENFSKTSNNGDVKIYCSRPGARLWTANFEATVLTTYQFRNSFNLSSSNIIVLGSNSDERLNLSKFGGEEISKHFNFGRLFVLYPNIILTYDNKGVYFFNVESSTLLCWSHVFDNIKDIRILKPYIYIWRNDLQIDIIALQSVEELIVSTLLNKQYFLCAELCLHFNEDVLNLIEHSKKINLISILSTKLRELGDEELLEKIKNILNKLDKYYNSKKLGIKLENGIVVIDNQYSVQKIIESVHSPNIPPPVDDDLRSLYKQYVLNRTHKLAELTETSKIFKKSNSNDLLSLFQSFIKFVQDKYSEDASVWCKTQMIKHSAIYLGNFENLDASTFKFLSEAFLEANNFQEDCCKCCKFPLPIAHMRKLEYFDLACRLYEFSEDKTVYLHNIPILFKHKINKTTEITSNICLIVQFSDKEVYKDFGQQIPYDTWDEVIKMFIKLQNGRCLNCMETISIDGILTWTEIGLIMIESVGAKNTLRLLRRYSHLIPKGQLDVDFYKSCIFSTTCDDRKLGIDFMEGTKLAGNLNKLEEYMGQYLQKKYLGNHPQSRTLTKTDINGPKCSYCNLSVDNHVLVDVKNCDCGRHFHLICFNNNNNICTYCVNESSN